MPLVHAELPEGWALSTLAEVCHVNPPKPRRDQVEPTTEVTFVPMPAVDATSGTIAAPQIRQFSDVRIGFTAFRDDDVIMAKITPCMENGKAAVARGLRHGLGFGSTEFHVLRSRRAVLPDYVYHFIRQPSFRSAAEMEMTGSVGQKRVPASFLESAEIPVPPLAEQKRIADRIETLLKSVDAARERLAKVPAILKRLRQSILAAACSGQLTEEWRLANPGSGRGSDIVRAIREDRGTKFQATVEDRDETDHPDTWAVTTLGFLAEPTLKGRSFVTSGSRAWAGRVGEHGPYFIRSENINTEHLRLDCAVHVNAPPGAEADRTRVRPNDLLLTITGNNVGRTAVVPEPCPDAHVSQHVAIIRTSRRCDVRFLWLWLRSDQHGQAQLRSHFYGQTKPGLSLEQVKSVRVFLPPAEEQHEIVRRVEELMDLVATISDQVRSSAKCVERLAHAVLVSAFRGELVPAEAELARTDGRVYESAEALLTRIRAESARPDVVPPARRPRVSPQPVTAAPAGGPASALSPKRTRSPTIFYKRAAIAAYIIGRLHTRPTFGRVQLEKCLYLAEAYVGVDLEGDFKRAAAGPLDAEYLYKLENAAQKNGWFVKRTIAGDKTRHTYHPGAKSAQLLAAAEKYLGAGKAKMDFLLGWVEKFDTERAEIVATLFAAWSDLLRAGHAVTDDAIITEFRENWHESKKRFEPDRLRIALGWMRQHALVPPAPDA